jgi:ATP-dependent helicase/nuclease subunit A
VTPELAQRGAADGRLSAWVAASAGTGKTKVLTDRVLNLLLAGSDPARILCLTFTRAAAAEMANRLNERLALWAIIPDGKLTEEITALLGRVPAADDLARARRLFARVLDTPNGMKIETIHAFCQSLLRRFPLEAQIAPHFETMDERNAREALAEAQDRMLAEATTGADPRLGVALAEVTRHLAELRFDELMQALVGERARLADALADGFERFRRNLASTIGIAPDAAPEAVVAAACAGAPDFSAAADRMLQSASAQDRQRGAAIAQFCAAPVSERPALFDEYCKAFLTQEGCQRNAIQTKALATSSPANETALLREAARLEAARQERARASLLSATLALAALGDRILALYRRHKDERVLLDYDDLVLGARELLCRPGVPPWVLYKLDGGIDHILIDEAQDTNPEQWDVVRALAEEFFVGLSARTGRTIFAVGDTKQSIFSFQRAEPRRFFAMRDHFAARARDCGQGWREVPLELSFRSTEAVLSVVDAVFARPEARAGVALDRHPIRHYAHRTGAGGLVELWPAVPAQEDPDETPWDPPVRPRPRVEPHVRLAHAIAAQIKLWVDRGERLAARDRPIRPRDVLVLVRRREPFVAALVRALKERRIEVAGADRMRLVDQLAIEDVMALLQFLLLPEDDLTLATVLKGPLFGFDDTLLFELANPRAEGTSLWAELRRVAHENEAFAAAYGLLSELLGRADYAPPYELIADILGARGGRRSFLARLGPEAEDPLDELMAAALAYERRHGPSLQGFLYWLKAGDIEVKRDFDERGRDEVRIMTAHGAKGLQAPIVFLPDTLGVPRKDFPLLWSEDGLLLWRANKGCGAAALERARAEAERRQAEEYRRLLYVAMTRAEDRLYVCGWRMKKTFPGNWYELVEAGMKEAHGVEMLPWTAPIADGWSGTALRLASPQTVAPKDDAAKGPVSHITILPDWAKRRPAPEPVPPRPLAPSRPDRDEPAARSPLGTDEGLGFRRGLIVHRLLQTLPQLDPAAREAAGRRYLAQAVHGLDAAMQAEILAETLAVLEDPDFAPLFGPGSLGEVPVVGLAEGRAISGRIDRLVVREASVLIVDYKTLRPVPASEAEIPPLYLDQLRAYRAAIMGLYPGRGVRCALLWTDGPKLMEVSAARLGIDA